jgi:succinate dehydrogenase / fumarate reductase, cytochrome b subunit
MKNQPTPQNFMRWFDPRNRHLGTWGFILNRVTAIGLTVYLFLHLIALSQLSQGPGAYDTFIRTVENPLFKLGEMLVIAGGLIHGLNGIRIALNSFGIGVTWQRQMFLGLMTLALVGILIFGAKMFLGA